MTESKRKILELQHITAGYKDQIVLEDVNFTITETEFVGVIGANGSGKTTLLRLILGLNRAISGTIRFFFDEHDLNGIRMDRAVSKYIGYLPQVAMFDRKFPITVFDVVLSGLTGKRGLFRQFSKNDRQKAEQMITQMKIDHLQQKIIGELSGGQMQRVFLARALINSPKLLLLDEPNTFVDKGFEKSFFDILKELNKEIAIILVSHDIGMISSYVKTIACVNRFVHHHQSNKVPSHFVENYNCPIDLITHGELPHRVLKSHTHGDDAECHCQLLARQGKT